LRKRILLNIILIKNDNNKARGRESKAVSPNKVLRYLLNEENSSSNSSNKKKKQEK